MGTLETSREPCPDRILDEVGGAFGIGAVGGSAFYFIKDLHLFPKGERLVGGVQAVRMNAPRVGGSFAVWGGLFSAFDCAMFYVRQKEDPWNSIIAGAATGGFLQMRQGLRPASRSALFSGVFFALIEGACIMLNRGLSVPQNLPPTEDPNAAMMPPNVAAMAGAGGVYAPQGMATSSMTDDSATASSSSDGAGSSKTEILESFDAPSFPIPTFEFK